MKALFCLLSAIVLFSTSAFADNRPPRDFCEVKGTVLRIISKNKVLLKITYEKIALDQVGDNSCKVDDLPYNKLLTLPSGTGKVQIGQTIHALMSVRYSGEYKMYTIVRNLGK